VAAIEFSITPDAKASLKAKMDARWQRPRFALAINTRGGLHAVSVGRIHEASRDWNANGMPVEFEGRAFCGYKGDHSYWTNWREYAKVEELCKKCLKAWVRACSIEGDPDALAELQNLLPDEGA
jgi:hypothetical protein